MNECTFIIFGATGDLTKRKLIPALYQLIRDKKIDTFAILGIALENVTPDHLIDASLPFIDSPETTIIEQLKKHTYYQPIDFNYPNNFVTIKKTIEQIEQQNKLQGNRLAYLACPPEYFCIITTALINNKIIVRASKTVRPWYRVVYEKPFGTDTTSAHEINNCIAAGLEEQQAFRIDHYLAKEVVGNIALVRFTNRIFEPLWNNQHIDHVEIILTEELGIGTRGTFYDHYGALKDIVQNHMLQLLALIAMEAPQQLSGEFMRDEKARVLQHTKPIDGILGQYNGYQQENGVAPHSITETFAALQLHVDNNRWRGVPFYLKTGKALNKKETIIYIKFKMVDCLLTKSCPSDSNYLIIRLYPDAEFSIEINAKKPGVFGEVIPVIMSFSNDLYGPATPNAYETLFQEVMKGDQSISVRFDEIEYAWHIIDAVKKMHLPLYQYKPGSTGPEEANIYAQKHNFRWQA